MVLSRSSLVSKLKMTAWMGAGRLARCCAISCRMVSALAKNRGASGRMTMTCGTRWTCGLWLVARYSRVSGRWPSSLQRGLAKRRSAMSIDSPTAMSMPKSTPLKNTPAAVNSASQASPPRRSERNSGRGLRLCESMPATMAASAGMGNSASQLRASHSSSTMTKPANTPASRLRPPALWLADEAEKPTPAGKPCSSPQARLMMPSAAMSRRALTLSP